MFSQRVHDRFWNTQCTATGTGLWFLFDHAALRSSGALPGDSDGAAQEVEIGHTQPRHFAPSESKDHKE